MTTDHSDKDRISAREPGLFSVEEEALFDSKTMRQPEIFVPGDDEALATPPESISDGMRLPHEPNYAGIHLEALPVKGLKTFLYCCGILIMLLIGWELYGVVKWSMSVHWLLTSALSILLLIAALSGLGLVWHYLNDRETLKSLKNIQTHAIRMKEGFEYGNAGQFVEHLRRYYEGKPQAMHFKSCLDQLPDYSNDRETLDHVERVFLRPLDDEALRRISKHTLQTGAAIAISPWATLDMAIVLWRNLRMIDDVAQVYGVRPSLTNRYHLLRLVIYQLTFVGTTDVVIDQLRDIGSANMALMLSARFAQGLGACIYTAKIGIAAIKVSRPIEFSKKQEPNLKSLVAPQIQYLKQLLSLKQEPNP